MTAQRPGSRPKQAMAIAVAGFRAAQKYAELGFDLEAAEPAIIPIHARLVAKLGPHAPSAREFWDLVVDSVRTIAVRGKYRRRHVGLA